MSRNTAQGVKSLSCFLPNEITVPKRTLPRWLPEGCGAHWVCVRCAGESGVWILRNALVSWVISCWGDFKSLIVFGVKPLCTALINITLTLCVKLWQRYWRRARFTAVTVLSPVSPVPRPLDYKQFGADKTSAIVLCIVAGTIKPCCYSALLGATSLEEL